MQVGLTMLHLAHKLRLIWGPQLTRHIFAWDSETKLWNPLDN